MTNDQTLEEQQLRIYTAMQMVFIEIFKIIGHSQSEAEENATIIMSKISYDALQSLIEKKSPEEQEKIATILKDAPIDKAALLQQIFQQSEIQDAMQKATQLTLTEYFESIKSSLTEKQSKQLHALKMEMAKI